MQSNQKANPIYMVSNPNQEELFKFVKHVINNRHVTMVLIHIGD